MAQGTTEKLELFNAPLVFHAGSDNPAVFTTTVTARPTSLGNGGSTTEDSLSVTAVAPGQALLQISDSSGDLLDQIELSVEAPASVVFGEPLPDGGLLQGAMTFALDAGDTGTLAAEAFGADGRELQCSTGWSYSTPSYGVVIPFVKPCDLICLGALSTGEDATLLDIQSAGANVVTAQLGALDASVPVTVVP